MIAIALFQFDEASWYAVDIRVAGGHRRACTYNNLSMATVFYEVVADGFTEGMRFSKRSGRGRGRVLSRPGFYSSRIRATEFISIDTNSVWYRAANPKIQPRYQQAYSARCEVIKRPDMC